jgi:hypothetical protein
VPERRNKMIRKIVILIPVFFLFLGLDNCKSPVASGNKKSDLYRYNVEVIYSDVAEGGSDFPLFLYYGLHELWGAFESGNCRMSKIGEKKARAYIPKVLIVEEDSSSKHWVSVVDPNKEPFCHRGENIEVQGAYELEISKSTYPPYESHLLFKMSKD